MSRDRVIVVGAGGFLGRACVRALASTGAVVDGVDVIETPVEGAASWTVADVVNEGLPDTLLAHAGTLIYLAWRNDPGRGNANMVDDVRSNVAGAVRSFEQAARAGVRRIIYPSSGGTIYGKEPPLPTPESAPVSPVGGYGAGKAAAEFYLNAVRLAYGVETCALRIANPYGPGQYPERGQGFIATALARTLRGVPIQVFGTVALGRDYIYIDDVAESFALACTAKDVPHALNVGSGIERSISDLIPHIFAAAGRSTQIELVAGRPVDVPRVQLDVALIGRSLGWRPRTSIEAGLQLTVNWMRQQMLNT